MREKIKKKNNKNLILGLIFEKKSKSKKFILIKFLVIAIIFIIFLTNLPNFKVLNEKPQTLGREKIVEKDFRLGNDFNRGETKDAFYNHKTKRLYLLKKQRVEVKNTKYSTWKTYNLDIVASEISVGKKKIFIKTQNGEIYSYDKKFKNKTLVHGIEKSKIFSTMADISSSKAYPLGESKILLISNDTEHNFEIYNLELNNFEALEISGIKKINVVKKIDESSTFIGTDKGLFIYKDNEKIKKIKKINTSVKDFYFTENKLWILSEERELAEYSINKNKEVIKTTTLIDKTKFSGEAIKSVNKDINNKLYLLDKKGGLFSYDIIKRSWSKLEKNVNEFYLSETDILIVKKNTGILINQKDKGSKMIVNKEILAVYPNNGYFLVIAKGKEKNVLLKLQGNSIQELIGGDKYSGDIEKIDLAYLFNDKIFLFKENKKIEYYDYIQRNWKKLEFVMPGRIKRIRSNKTNMFFLINDKLYSITKNNFLVKEVKSEVKSYEIYDEKIAILKKNGTLDINGMLFFQNKSNYSFETIKKIIDLKNGELLVLFKNGVSTYDKKRGNWNHKLDYKFKKNLKYILSSGRYIILSDGETVKKIEYTGKEIKSIDILKISNIQDLKIINDDKLNVLFETATSKNQILIDLNNSSKSRVEKILSKGLALKNYKEIKYIVKMNEDLIIGSENKLFSYSIKTSNWNEILEGDKIHSLKVVNKRLFIERGVPKRIEEVHLNDNKKARVTKLGEKYTSSTIIGNTLILEKNHKIILKNLDNNLNSKTYFSGTLKPVGKIRSIKKIGTILYLTDDKNFWKYDEETYSASFINIGQRKKEYMTDSGLFFLTNGEKSKNIIKYIDFDFKEIIKTSGNIKDFWVKNGEISYVENNRLMKISKTNKVSVKFSPSKIPFTPNLVEEYYYVNDKIYVILKNGYTKYDVKNRKWDKITVSKISKTVVDGNDIYFLMNNHIYKNEKKIELDSNLAIKDFTVLEGYIYYYQGGDLKTTAIKKNQYFIGNGNLDPNKITAFVETSKYKIFGGDKGIAIYNIEKHSWKNIPMYTPNGIFYKNQEYYITSKKEITVYNNDFSNKIYSKTKKFSETIKNISVNGNRMAILFNSGNMLIYENNQWVELKSEKAPFNFMQIQESIYKDQLYITTNKGLYSYSIERNPKWKLEEKGDFTGYSFKLYNDKLAIVGNSAAYLKTGARWKLFSIDNGAFKIEKDSEIYIKDKVLYYGARKNKTTSKILSTAIGTIKKQENYYYISNNGISKYNYTTHSWEEKNYDFNINSFYKGAKGIYLSTTSGEIIIDYLTLGITKGVYQNVLSSNEKYKIIKDTNGIKLYNKISGSIESQIEKEDYYITNLQGAYEYKGKDYLVDDKNTYIYDLKDAKYKRVETHSLGEIYNIIEKDGNIYYYSKKGIFYTKGNAKRVNYANYKGEFYTVKDGSLYNPNGKKLFTTVEGIYSSSGDVYFTNSGTFKYFSDLGVYLKLNTDLEPRYYLDGKMYVSGKDEIKVYSLKPEESIKGAKIYQTISISRKISFITKNTISSYIDLNKKLQTFKKDEKIKELLYLDNTILLGLGKDMVVFSTINKNKDKKYYAYEIKNKTVKEVDFKDIKPKKVKSRSQSNNFISGVYLTDKSITLIGARETITLSKSTGLVLKITGTLEPLKGKLIYSQEGNQVMVNNQGVEYTGTSLTNLKKKNFSGVKKSVRYKNNKFIYNQYSKGNGILRTDIGTDEDALEGNKLRASSPIEFVLGNGDSFGIRYTHKIILNDGYSFRKPTESLVFVKNKNIYAYRLNGKYYSLKKRVSVEPYQISNGYYLLKDNKMIFEFQKKEYDKSYRNGIFLEDSFISISSNPGKLFISNGNQIYDENFKLLKMIKNDKVNADGKAILIKENLKYYKIIGEGKKLINKFDKHYSVNYDGLNWSNRENEKSQLLMFGINQKENKNSFPLDNTDSIYTGSSSIYIANSGTLMELSGNKKKFILNNLKLKTNFDFKYENNDIKFYNEKTKKESGFEYKYSQTRKIEGTSKYSKRYSKDKLKKIASTRDKLSILVEDGIYTLDRSGLKYVSKKYTDLFEILDKSYVRNEDNYYNVENLDKRLSRPKLKLDLSDTKKMQIDFGNRVPKIKYYSYSNEDVYEGNYFLFDSLSKYFEDNGIGYRYKNNRLIIPSDYGIPKSVGVPENIAGVIYFDGRALLNGKKKYVIASNQVEPWNSNLYKTIKFDELGKITIVENGKKNMMSYRGYEKSWMDIFKIHSLSSLDKNLYLFGNGILKAKVNNTKLELVPSSQKLIFTSSIKKNIDQIIMETPTGKKGMYLNEKGDEIIYLNPRLHNKVVKISNTKIDIAIEETSNLKWELKNKIPEDEIFQLSNGNLYFVFDNITKFDNHHNYYASNNYIFKYANLDTKNLMPVKRYPNKIVDINNQNKKENLYIKFSNDSIVNLVGKRLKKEDTPYGIKSFDFKNLKLYPESGKTPKFVYNGKLLYDAKMDDRKFSIDKINDIYRVGMNGYLSSEFGVYKKNITNLEKRDMILYEKEIEFIATDATKGIYVTNGINSYWINGTKYSKANKLNFINQIIINPKSVSQKTIKAEKSSLKIDYPLKKEFLSEDKKSFLWDDIKDFVIGDSKLILTKNGESWEGRNFINNYGPNNKVLIWNKNEYTYSNKVLKNKYKKNVELKSIGDTRLVSLLDPEAISLLRKEGKWSLGTTGQVKIRIEKIDPKDNFIDGKFNFDFIEILDSNYISDKYRWNLKTGFFVDKIGKVSDAYRIKNYYYKVGENWYDKKKNIIKEANIGKSDKWIWSKDLNSGKIKFKSRSGNKVIREFKNNQFSDDVVKTMLHGDNQFFVSTNGGTFIYSSSYRESKSEDILKEYDKKAPLKLYNNSGVVGFILKDIPKTLKSKDFMIFYEKPWLVTPRNRLYYYINKDKITLIYEK